MSILAVMVKEEEIRQVPKLGLTLQELIFCFGTEQLVDDLRRIGVLKPLKYRGRTMLFDVGEANQVWAEFKAGTYEEALEIMSRGRGKAGE